MGACDYCGIERKKLKACSRCKSAHFCNKTCFTAAWKAGHKAECNKKKKEAEEDDDLKQRMDSESYLDNPHALFYDVPIHPQYADELEDHLGMPFCPDESSLDTLPARLGQDGSREEFGFSLSFNPPFIDQCCVRGIFPMAIDIMRGVALMTPKLHTKRCIIADISTGLHVSKSTRKKARSLGLSMTADGGWDACIDMITRNHKRCWLYPQLHTAYKHMWKHRDKYTTQLHSFEVWDKEGRLVACELGFIVGTIYTSLTGATELSNAGSVQLAALGRALERAGVEVWDFGMSMAYKTELGAHEMPRAEWQALVAEKRGKAVTRPLLSSTVKESCRDVIDFKAVPSEEQTNTASTGNTTLTTSCTSSAAPSPSSPSSSSSSSSLDSKSSTDIQVSAIDHSTSNAGVVMSKNQLKKLRRKQYRLQKKTKGVHGRQAGSAGKINGSDNNSAPSANKNTKGGESELIKRGSSL